MRDLIPTPDTSSNRVPYHSDDCLCYDGKRCKILGNRPPSICEPAVKALLDRAEAAERDRDRLAVLVRAALSGELAGPWVRVDAKHDAWARTGAAVCLAGSVTTEDRTFKGTRDDADALLLAHGWTLMDEADAKLIAGGSDAD
jgi:hypothetical protein